MQHAQRNNNLERELTVIVDPQDFDKMMTDRRNGLQLGTLKNLCQQYGVTFKRQKRKVILKARRDALQMTVEKMHFCRVKYLMVE